MEIIWNGHACFTVISADYSIVLDPYGPNAVPGFAPLQLRADAVLCSHGHGDHNYAQAVTPESGEKACPFVIHTIGSWHDDAQGTLRGPNTIHLLEAEGMRVAHMGDIGCPLNAEQIEKLRGLDAVLIPVGGFYTVDAKQAAEMAKQLDARVIIPMHYRGEGFGLTKVGTLDEFTKLWPAEFVRRYESSSLTLMPDTAPQAAVLKPLYA